MLPSASPWFISARLPDEGPCFKLVSLDAWPDRPPDVVPPKTDRLLRGLLFCTVAGVGTAGRMRGIGRACSPLSATLGFSFIFGFTRRHGMKIPLAPYVARPAPTNLGSGDLYLRGLLSMFLINRLSYKIN